jgi:hypothetical protein
MTSERRYILVGVRVNAREHARWVRAATLEGLRLPELLRESVRLRLDELARVRELERSEPPHEPPASAA